MKARPVEARDLGALAAKVIEHVEWLAVRPHDPTLPHVLFVLEDDGAIRGVVSFYNIRPGATTDFGVTVFGKPSAGLRVVLDVLKAAFETLGLKALEADIWLHNQRAMTAARRLGMVQVAIQTVGGRPFARMRLDREQFFRRWVRRG